MRDTGPAARGGTVKLNSFQGRAGNYVVIDGADTFVDYAYMHLLEPCRFPEGSMVHTGQQLGLVGQTGRAFGCHLHFEMWTAPGGRPVARRSTRCLSWPAWDGYS